MNDLISWYSESYEKDILDNMTERGKNRTIITLYQQLAEKDAMIDWLVFRLQSYCNNPLIINCVECRKGDCHNNNWRKAAQEAVRKNG